jgi:hypothetical protein
MGKSEYRVLLTGEVLPGFRREEVIAALAHLFRAPAGQVLRLMNAGESPIDNLFDAERALQLQIELEQLGARTRVERDRLTMARRATSPALRLPEPDADTVRLIECQVCGHRQPSGWRCDECGMVFEQAAGHVPVTARRSRPRRRPPPVSRPVADIHTRQNAQLRNDWLEEHDTGPTEDHHVKLFMGAHGAELARTCEGMMLGRRTQFRLSFAGGAVISPFLWAMYRKMWAWGMVILLTAILLPTVLISWGTQPGVSLKVTLLGVGLLVANRLFWPFLLKWLYCRHARKTIAMMNRMSPTFAPDIDIASRGGTSRTSAFVGVVIAMVVILLTWSTVDSVHTGVTEPGMALLPTEPGTATPAAVDAPAAAGAPRRPIAVPQQTQSVSEVIKPNKWVITRGKLRGVGRQLMSWRGGAGADVDLTVFDVDDIQRVLDLNPQQLVDGWDRRVRFSADERGYLFASAGPDGQFGNADDIEYRRTLRRP